MRAPCLIYKKQNKNNCWYQNNKRLSTFSCNKRTFFALCFTIISVIIHITFCILQAHIFSTVSQEPVQTAWPSGDTPIVDRRFSCVFGKLEFDPRRIGSLSGSKVSHIIQL